MEFTHMVMGPTCGMILASLGAEVIKIEPISGDRTRYLLGVGTGFFPMFNRGKKSVAIDLHTEEGATLVKKLALTADVVLENFKPGSMSKYDLDYQSLSKTKKDIIYVSLKGFLPGPYEHRTALDEVVQMMGGLAYMTGRSGDPIRAGSSVNDIMGGMFGAIAALGALMQREKTGRGQEVKSALFENNVFLVGQHMLQYAITKESVPPLPDRISAWGVYDVFTVNDKVQIFLAAVSDAQWIRFCEVLGFEDLKGDPKYEKNNDRVKLRSTLLPLLRERLLDRDAAEIAALFEHAGLPFARIKKPEELFDDPHLTATGALDPVLLTDGEYAGEEVKAPLMPFTLNGLHAGKGGQPPKLGDATKDILKKIGISEEKMGDLYRKKVVA